MSKKREPLLYMRRFLATIFISTTAIIFLALSGNLATARAQTADLVLQDTTISGQAEFTASVSITMGPDFTITGSGEVTTNSPKVSILPQFYIAEGGRMHIVTAGEEVGMQAERSFIPDEFALSQNYPNPFNPKTTIEYSVPKSGRIVVAIYDVTGQHIRDLVHTVQQPGHYTIEWDGTNTDGESVSSGTYLYRITAGKFQSVKKMVLLR
ncbi:MAG: T9SS type A sorting domain-containing protein [Candidatus Marinimicrobia bacterium]|nr:T9SS type A sorting domain-containing protein [Candidatus Neomarinimicrobiota bacterium]MCF7830368.1 T9SS type A sorting domain-containing protein [Candidatus Neomarinimicrobiota bacterium]MCF7882166.1 T9SS type A sorting domain-containing protein [Candidatus Neomarinimicrobiota bacterium]